jgi:lactococcin 972 family bacteriocin
MTFHSFRGENAMRRNLTVGLASAAMIIGLAGPAFATVTNVGGGTWNYGTSYGFPSTTHVWSNYVHPTRYHSSTAICGSNNVKHYADATVWSNSSTQCNVLQSNAAYWSTY